MELLIDNEVLNIPEELTLGMYQELMKNPTKYKSPLQVISLFTGLTIHELKNMNKDQIELIELVLSNKIVIPEQEEIILTFIHDGVEYGLENDWSKMAWGAWVDIEVYSHPDEVYKNLNKIMAVIYRPVISKHKKDPKRYKIEPYKSEEIEDRAEIFSEIPARYWLGCASFFLLTSTIYFNSISHSMKLTNKLKKTAMKGWTILPKWIQDKLPLDSILTSLTNLPKKT